MILGLLLACGSGSEAVIWQGWTYRWDTLGHRISYLEVEANPEGGATMGHVGGDWSTGETFTDAPLYRVRMSRVISPSWVVVQGETELTVGPKGELSVTEQVDDAALAAQPEHVVLLRGFAMDTVVEQSDDYPADVYDPAYGYTSRGFAFSAENVHATAQGVVFDLDAVIRWAPQDRDDMNAAVPYATTGVRVAWTAIGFEGEAAHQDFSASAIWPHTPPYSPQPPFGEEDLPLSLSSGTPAGVIGLSAFDLRVDAQDGSNEGDYLRSYGVELIPTEERADGFEGYARAEITNSSLIEAAAISSVVSGTATWVGLADGSTEVEPLVLSGSHPVGVVEVAPPAGWQR